MGRKPVLVLGWILAALVPLLLIWAPSWAWVIAANVLAHPAWRARTIGVYRLWRDGGFAAGAALAGITADVLGVRAAVWIVAAVTALSGMVVALRMYETHDRPATTTPAPLRASGRP